jgi:hypothetical protein
MWYVVPGFSPVKVTELDLYVGDEEPIPDGK